MGYKAIIYGRIEGAREFMKKCKYQYGVTTYHYNRCVVQGLPDTDDDLPFLTRHMFSLAQPKLEWNYDRGIYKTQIIHFGASLSLASDHNTAFVNEWLDKIEQLLLKPLIWYTAVVHFEHELEGNCAVRYIAEKDSVHQVIEELHEVGTRVEANIEWERQPKDPSKAFDRTSGTF